MTKQAADEKGTVRQSFYLPRAVHEVLREQAFKRRISQQEIFRQALDLWLKEQGLPSWTVLADDFEDI